MQANAPPGSVASACADTESGRNAQVGNFTLERATWQRPEEMQTRRPVYYVATKNGAQAPTNADALQGSLGCPERS